MYKTRALNGKNNLAGENIARLRKNMKDAPSQRAFAEILQRASLDLDKNAVSRIESGDRFITDIELQIIANVFNTSCDFLLKPFIQSETAPTSKQPQLKPSGKHAKD